MSKTAKQLSLTITYKVGYGDVKMPKEIYEQLLKAYKNGGEIEMHKYPDVVCWMSSNVKEGDCFDWKAEIDNIEG